MLARNFVFILPLVLFCLSPTSNSVAQGAEWTTIAEFDGSSHTQTRAFTISGAEWRARWRCNRKIDAYGGLFQAQLKEPGKDWTGETVVNTLLHGENSDSGTSYQYSSGRFYLDIVASNTSWELTIQVPKE